MLNLACDLAETRARKSPRQCWFLKVARPLGIPPSEASIDCYRVYDADLAVTIDLFRGSQITCREQVLCAR